MSNERLEAEYFANECERLVELCGFLIPQPQQERLQKLNRELHEAINSNNCSGMQSLPEKAKQEIRNLPNEVQMVMACFAAISRANALAPTQASAMADKLSRMLSALKSSDGHEADRLWRELQPDVSHWLNQELPSGSIVTGLTR